MGAQFKGAPKEKKINNQDINMNKIFLYHNLGKVNDAQILTFLNKGKLWFVLRACYAVQGTVFSNQPVVPGPLWHHVSHGYMDKRVDRREWIE